jgi:hypothetical protein
VLTACLSDAKEAPPRELTAPSRAIGLEATWELELDGSLLDVRRYSLRSPVELRIEEVSPVEGGYRYRFRYTVLEPGRHDLKSLLERRDGSTTDDLPALVVETASLLPVDEIIGVEPVQIGEELLLGGYTRTMALLAVVWLVGLALLILVGRKRVPLIVPHAEEPQPTVADLLQPLVLRAAEGTLDHDGKARLERLFIAFWREKLGLENTPMTEVMTSLRRHVVAGELLENFTQWFHRPSQLPVIEVSALMEPYREINAAEIESRMTGNCGNA